MILGLKFCVHFTRNFFLTFSFNSLKEVKILRNWKFCFAIKETLVKGSNGSKCLYPKITHENARTLCNKDVVMHRFLSILCLKLGYIFAQLSHPFWVLETLSYFNCYITPTRTIKDQPNCFYCFQELSFFENEIMNITKPKNLFTHLNKFPQKGLRNAEKREVWWICIGCLKKTNPFSVIG